MCVREGGGGGEGERERAQRLHEMRHVSDVAMYWYSIKEQARSADKSQGQQEESSWETQIGFRGGGQEQVRVFLAHLLAA